MESGDIPSAKAYRRLVQGLSDPEGLDLPAPQVGVFPPPDRETLQDPSRRFGPPTVTGEKRYVVLNRLGEGGMSFVDLAFDTQLQRPVALKRVRADRESESTRARFLREAQIAAQVHHPNVVPVHDAGSDGDYLYLTMEYVEGTTLDRCPRGDLRATLDLVRRIALALQAAHTVGIVHRDVKPSNILVTRTGEPMVADFGIARGILAPSDLTETGTTLGTPAYMSPEQVLGRVAEQDARTDVYGLGVVLYERLTGRRPFDGPTVPAIAAAILCADPPRPRSLTPSISHDVEAIVLKAMERDREHRYASMGEFAEDLGRALQGEPVSAAGSSIRRTLRIQWRRHRRHAALVAGIFLVLGAAHWAWGAVLRSRARALHDQAQTRFDEAQRVVRVEDAEARRRLLSESAALLAQVDSMGLTTPEDEYLRGRVYLVQADYAAAIRSFDRVLALQPSHGLAALDRLRAWLGWKVQSAWVAAEMEMPANTPNFKDLVPRGDVGWRAQEVTEARRLLEILEALDAHRYREVIAAFEALPASDRIPEAFVCAALAYYMLWGELAASESAKEDELALKMLDEATTRDPQFLPALMLRGEVLLAQGRIEDAIRVAEAAERVAGRLYRTCHYVRAVCSRALCRREEARRLYAEMVASDPNAFDALYDLGVMAFEDGHDEHAEEYLARSRESASGVYVYPTMYMLGCVYVRRAAKQSDPAERDRLLGRAADALVECLAEASQQEGFGGDESEAMHHPAFRSLFMHGICPSLFRSDPWLAGLRAESRCWSRVDLELSKFPPDSSARRPPDGIQSR